MERVELPEDLKTGINEIDNQHEQLLNWAKAISGDVLADDDKLSEALNNLNDYVNYHFRAEEQAMETHDYDRLGKHKAQHHRLMAEVTELFGRLYREGATKGLLAEVQYMFADWYYLHIREWDKPFADFLKSKNVSPTVSLT